MLTLLHHAAGNYHSVSHLSHTFHAAHEEMSTTVFDLARESVEAVRLKIRDERLASPRVAIVCGSGLGGLAECVNRDEDVVELRYEDVVHFPVGSVPGHEGKLVFSTMGSRRVPVVLLVGRAHFYEGHSMETVTFATRVCKVLGVETMILTNAAGGLNPDYSVGDVVLLNEHLNLAGLVGTHPLRGPNASDFGPRFPPLSDAYDISLRQTAHKAWHQLREQSPSERRLHEGIYAFVGGPSYETRAECRMLRMLGADVVGMSTVPEIIVARHCGMKVLAFSLVTNKSVLEATVRADDPEVASLSPEALEQYMSRGKANHEEVLEAGKVAAKDMQGLVVKVVEEL